MAFSSSVIAHINMQITGIVFGGYVNYAIFGSTYKSVWAERGWACKFHCSSSRAKSRGLQLACSVECDSVGSSQHFIHANDHEDDFILYNRKDISALVDCLHWCLGSSKSDPVRCGCQLEFIVFWDIKYSGTLCVCIVLCHE